MAAVIDLFSRRVVGWSMSAAMTAQFVTDALVMAIWRRGKPDALLHHSDRGSQYTSNGYRALLECYGIVLSMSGKGEPYDNALFTCSCFSRIALFSSPLPSKSDVLWTAATDTTTCE